MYITSGRRIDVSLGEAIATTNPDWVSTSVNSGQEASVLAGQASGASTVSVVSGEGGFVDEIMISNVDTIAHTVNIDYYDGSASRRMIKGQTLPAGQTLQYKPAVGWNIPCQPPNLSSGAVLSGNIASGQIGFNHLGANSVGPSRIASGAVTSACYASGSISTFKIASGQLTLQHHASGVLPVDAFTTEETISGNRPVNISQSGSLRVAMAGVSGRMPAVGILMGNVASGAVVSHLSGNAPVQIGTMLPTSGMLPHPAVFGQPVFVGMSGALTQTLVSGMVAQRVGVMLSSGRLLANVYPHVTSGGEPTDMGTF